MSITITAPRALDRRIRAYMRAHHILECSIAAIELLTIALDHLDARRSGADAANRQRTSTQRSAGARAAAVARWYRHREEQRDK